ncbi:N-acyl-D-amino-acid deacylase family protein [Nocardia sp.]
MYDTVIEHARWFDGTGAPSAIRHIGLRDGRVAAVSAEPLDTTGCPRVLDGTGKWVLPGMLDIHTHYDVEILGSPALLESLRHGVTTVLIGSCSISTVHVGAETAGDLFGRVEAIPRHHVIDAVEKHKSWTSAAEYARALEQLPLGPNVAAFIGHSDMRAAVMGLDRATRADVRPVAAELDTMARWLEEALDAGFVGMSSQQLRFDKLDGEFCRSRTLPSTFATAKEKRRLNSILRRRGRVLQGGPDASRPHTIGLMAAAALGLGRRALKVSLLSAADLKALPVIGIFTVMSKVLNALGADFRWQHLPVPFEVYADGIDLVIFEEFGSGAAAMHLSNQVDKRRELLADPDYRRRFRKDYDKKFGPRVWHRDFFDAEIVDCPDPAVIGKSFGQVGLDRGGLHPVDAFLDLVVEHGDKLRWRTTISGHRPEMLDRLAADPGVQMGFSDAGAHLRNMAFYNFGLRFLRRMYDAERAGRPVLSMERAVHRLTGELGQWYGIDAGTLREGDRADLVLLDPDRLDGELDAYAEAPVAQYGNLERMVNRNDGAVKAVFVGGEYVFGDGVAAETLGLRRTGRFLRAN